MIVDAGKRGTPSKAQGRSRVELYNMSVKGIPENGRAKKGCLGACQDGSKDGSRLMTNICLPPADSIYNLSYSQLLCEGFRS